MKSQNKINIATIMIVLVLFLSNTVYASTNKSFKRFSENTPDSQISIGYEDLTALLNQNVLVLGRSFRLKAKRIRANTGTRLKSTIKRNTALEGNRFYFKSFLTTERKQILSDIRSSLESLPDEVSLNEFNREEQLAFWLNIYNVTLLESLVSITEKNNMEDFLYGDDSFLDKKLLHIAGMNLSLNNIQYDIVLPNFSEEPNVIYGFFQGVIGAPDIRNEAYTGKLVYQQLKDNAITFINSNRGTFKRYNGTLRVSNLYQRNSQWFPNFNLDLSKHLTKYLDSDYYEATEVLNKLVVDIQDMNFVNLRGGTRDFRKPIMSGNAALMGMGDATVASMFDYTKSVGNISQAEAKLIKILFTNSNIRRGTVIIKEENTNE